MTRNLSRRDALRTFPLVGGGLLLTRCAGAPTVVSDIQAVLNDAAAVYPIVERFIPAPFGGAVALVLTGLQSLVNLVAGSIAAGATTEGTVLVGLSSALAQVKADTALSGTASTALGDAIALVDDLGASSSSHDRAAGRGRGRRRAARRARILPAGLGHADVVGGQRREHARGRPRPSGEDQGGLTDGPRSGDDRDPREGAGSRAGRQRLRSGDAGAGRRPGPVLHRGWRQHAVDGRHARAGGRQRAASRMRQRPGPTRRR